QVRNAPQPIKRKNAALSPPSLRLSPPPLLAPYPSREEIAGGADGGAVPGARGVGVWGRTGPVAAPAVEEVEARDGVVWEQRPEDVEAEGRSRELTSLGFNFSAAGFLFPYHIGVAQCLIDRGFSFSCLHIPDAVEVDAIQTFQANGLTAIAADEDVIAAGPWPFMLLQDLIVACGIIVSLPMETVQRSSGSALMETLRGNQMVFSLRKHEGNRRQMMGDGGCMELAELARILCVVRTKFIYHVFMQHTFK
ncbi:hypothetical protein EJB05_52216, partial [Eragrostis curvula]